MRNVVFKSTLLLVFLCASSTVALSIKKISDEDGFEVQISHKIGKLCALKNKDLGAFIEVETNVLQIKTTVEDDLSSLVEFFSDPENVAMDGTGNSSGEQAIRKYYENYWLPLWKIGKFEGALTLFLRENKGKIIGQVSITCEGPGTGNLGLIIDKQYWNHGYAGEVCRVINELIAPLLIFLEEDFNGKPLEKMIFTTSIGNEAVVRLADRYGHAVFTNLDSIESSLIDTIEPSLSTIKNYKKCKSDYDVSNAISFISDLLRGNQLECMDSKKNNLFRAWACLDVEKTEADLLSEFCSILPNELMIWKCCIEKNGSKRSVWIQTSFDGEPIRPPKYCFQVLKSPEKILNADIKYL